MSKLPKAPLVEVVVELRWNITGKEDLTKVQYLYGDIYAELKQDYPFREMIVPVEVPRELLINQPEYRFRVEKDKYPLFQVGPGILTINTIADLYDWDHFSRESEEIIEAFEKVFELKPDEMIKPSILYLDFFPFNFEKDDVLDFVNQRFNITLQQNFFNNPSPPKEINLAYTFDIESIGELKINFQKALNFSKKEGLLLQTKVNGLPISANSKTIYEWLGQAHEVCSDVFKEMTRGELYESFK